MSDNKSKREGLTSSQLADRRRAEMEGRTRSVQDVRPKGAPRFMGTRASLRKSGQVRSSSVSNEIAAFRAVSESRTTATHPSMNPPISVRSSKPRFRKGVKRYMRRIQAQQEMSNG